MLELSSNNVAILGGLGGGIVLGFMARWGRFCTFAAIEDKILGHDGTRLRMWGLAIAIAILGTYGLNFFGLIDISNAIYFTAPPALAATILGGLMFGVGMSLVGTCGFGVLSRIGGGDLKSTVTFLVMGISAFATMNGVTAFLRLWLSPNSATPNSATSNSATSEAPASIAHVIGQTLGVNPNLIAVSLASILALTMLSNGKLLQHRRFLITGISVGLVIVFGWWILGNAATDPFEPQASRSYSFVAPHGDTILFIMASTGTGLDFGIGSVIGVTLGAYLTTLALRDFRWEACEDAIELKRQMLGGVLMGVGGVLALGCTVGQGLSAASTLAISAPITLISIYVGAWFGLQFLVSGSWWVPFRSLLSRQTK